MIVVALPDWWGYEISLPPPMLVKLSSVRSVQQTFFGFLQAFVIGGGESARPHVRIVDSSSLKCDAPSGAPEIAPFVRVVAP